METRSDRSRGLRGRLEAWDAYARWESNAPGPDWSLRAALDWMGSAILAARRANPAWDGDWDEHLADLARVRQRLAGLR